jgi:hypothetical protein
LFVEVEKQTARATAGCLERAGRDPQLAGPADELAEAAGHFCHPVSIAAAQVDGCQVCDSGRHAGGGKWHALAQRHVNNDRESQMAEKMTWPARFEVRAGSRFPQIGRDYDAATHRYRDAYLNPTGYAITVNAFPGMHKLVDAHDQQRLPGQPAPQDIWALNVPRGTTGWRFPYAAARTPSLPLARVPRTSAPS